MADTINQEVLLFDESGNKFYPKTNAGSIITTNKGTDDAYLTQQKFNDNINSKLTSNAELCKINNTVIKYGINNTLAVGTGGSDGSSGVTLSAGLSDLNTGLPITPSTGYLYYNGSNYTWSSISTGNTGSTTLSALSISDNNNNNLSYSGNAQKYLKFGDGIQGTLTTTTNSNDTLKISTVAGSFNGFQFFQTSSAAQYKKWNMGTDGYYMLQGGNGIELEIEDDKLTINATGSTTGGTSGTTGTLSNKLTIGNDSTQITFDGSVAQTIKFGNGFSVSGSGNALTITTTSTSGTTGSTSDITSSNLLDALKNKLSTQTIWGQKAANLFTTNGSINGNIYMQGTDDKSSIDISIYMDGTSSDNKDGTQVFKRHDNELIIGSGLANTSNSNTCISTQTTSIKTYKSNDETYNYTFTAANFDIGTNNIRLGSAETDEALIYWDTDNRCVRIKGSLCADGGITAFGVNSAETSTSNFDFGVISASEIHLGGDIVAGGHSLYDFKNEQLTLQRTDANDSSSAICKLQLTTSGSADVTSTGCAIYTEANVDGTTTTSDTKNNLSIFAGPKGTLYLGDTSQTGQQGINITNAGVVTLCVGQEGCNLKINQDGTSYKFNLQKAKDLGILTTN